jgi:hypothetical protein
MNWHKVRIGAAVFAGTIAVGASYFIGRARAGGVPTTAMTFGGVLNDATGTPLTGTKNIQVNFWDMPSGGTMLCATTSTAIALSAGSFRVTLPDACTTAVHMHPDVYSEVLVDGASVGRSKLGTVPYALEADSASRAAAGSSLDQRIAALESANTGKLAGMWAAAPAAGCISVTGPTDWAAVTGETVTFTLTAAASVWATYSINVQPGGASTTDFISFRLVVDGTASTMSGNHVQPYTTADANFTTVGNYVGTLAAGSHTIALQWAAVGTSTWSNCYGDNAGWTTPSVSQQTSIGQRSLVAVASYQ